MKSTGTMSLAAKLRQFARWFFTAAPTPVADPLDTLRPSKRLESARGPRRRGPLRAQHVGRVGVSNHRKPS